MFVRMCVCEVVWAFGTFVYRSVQAKRVLATKANGCVAREQQSIDAVQVSAEWGGRWVCVCVFVAVWQNSDISTINPWLLNRFPRESSKHEFHLDEGGETATEKEEVKLHVCSNCNYDRGKPGIFLLLKWYNLKYLCDHVTESVAGVFLSVTWNWLLTVYLAPLHNVFPFFLHSSLLLKVHAPIVQFALCETAVCHV